MGSMNPEYVIIEKPPPLPYVNEKPVHKVQSMAKDRIDILMEKRRSEHATMEDDLQSLREKSDQQSTELQINEQIVDMSTRICRIAERVYLEIQYLRSHLLEAFEKGTPTMATRERLVYLSGLLMDFLHEDNVESLLKSGVSAVEDEATVRKRQQKHLQLPELETDKSKTSRRPTGAQDVIDSRQDAAGSGPQLFGQEASSPFVFNPNTAVLLRLNPGSYHMLGLASPVSYVQHVQEKEQTLPWRPMRRESEYEEIHKPALNSLLLRVHDMEDSVYKAAMLSLKIGPGGERLDTSAGEQDEGGTVPSIVLPPDEQHEDDGDQQGSPVHHDLEALERQAAAEAEEARELKTFRRIATRSNEFTPMPQLPVPSRPASKLDASVILPPLSVVFTGQPLETSVEHSAKRLVKQPGKLYRETQLSVSQNAGAVSTLKQQQAAAAASASPTKPSSTSGSPPASHRSHKSSASAVSLWNQVKPASNPLTHPGLKWERVKDIVQHNLNSERALERREAARSLGRLGFLDPMVLHSLKKAMQGDPDLEVQFLSTQSLIQLRCWDQDLLRQCAFFLQRGALSTRLTLLHVMKVAGEVNYGDSELLNCTEHVSLCELLKSFCSSTADARVSYLSAHCLPHFHCNVEKARERLVKYLKENSKGVFPEQRECCTETCEILVRAFQEKGDIVVESVLELLQHSPDWRHRQAVAQLLATMGESRGSRHFDAILDVLEQRLWRDAMREVRLTAANAILKLGMLDIVCERAEKKLADIEERKRAEGISALGTLAVKNDRIIRAFLDMLNLDKSEYIRILVIRSFADIGLVDKRIMRILEEKQRLGGPLGAEANRTLNILKKAN